MQKYFKLRWARSALAQDDAMSLQNQCPKQSTVNTDPAPPYNLKPHSDMLNNEHASLRHPAHGFVLSCRMEHQAICGIFPNFGFIEQVLTRSQTLCSAPSSPKRNEVLADNTAVQSSVKEHSNDIFALVQDVDPPAGPSSGRVIS